MVEETSPRPGPKDLAFAMFPALLNSPGLVASACHLLLLFGTRSEGSLVLIIIRGSLSFLSDAYTQKNPPRSVPGSFLLPLVLDPWGFHSPSLPALQGLP